MKRGNVRRKGALLATGLAMSVFAAPDHVPAGGGSILVQSTTSTANSGLYDRLLPKFESQTGVRAHVVAVGTGQAIRNARNCDGDVLLVHDGRAEREFVADGHGVERFDLMYNDFVIVGPGDDPAKIAGGSDASVSLKKIASVGTPFVSRGDDSGTHRKELALWAAAGIDPRPASGKWYRETGSGMGATLNVGVGMGAYALTDRASWIGFGNKGDLEILTEGDEALFNQYGVILVNENKCPHVKSELGQTFIDWLLSPVGQSEIAAHRIAGRQLFFPNSQRLTRNP